MPENDVRHQMYNTKLNTSTTLLFLVWLLFLPNLALAKDYLVDNIENHLLQRCEGNSVFADSSEEEPNSTFSQANPISLIQGVCNTFIGHAGPRDSEYYGTKWCIGGSYVFNVCTGDETVVSDLYRINVSEFSKVRIQASADKSFGNIGFVVFQSNGDQFTNFNYSNTGSNYAEGTFQFSPDTYYIGIFARKTPDTYFVTAELVDDRPKLSINSNISNKFILNNRNIIKGIKLTIDKTNFDSNDSCSITSSNSRVTVTPTTTTSIFNQTITVKVNKNYAKSLIKQRRTDNATITASCTNGLRADYSILLTRP